MYEQAMVYAIFNLALDITFYVGPKWPIKTTATVFLKKSPIFNLKRGCYNFGS